MGCIVALALLLGSALPGGAALAQSADPGASSPAAQPAQPPPPSGGTGPAGGSGGDGLSGMTVTDVIDGARNLRVWLLAGATALVLVLLWVGDVLKPGGLTRNGKRDLDSLPWAVWLYSALVVWLAVALAAQWASGADTLGPPNPDTLHGAAVVSLVAFGVGLVVAIGMLYLTMRSAPSAGLKVVAADVPIGIGCFVLAAPPVMLVGEISRMIAQSVGAESDPIGHDTLRMLRLGFTSDPWLWALISSVVLLAPIVEEVIYRAFLQSATVKWFKLHWPGMIAASLVFAAAHWSSVPGYALAPLAVLGLALGIAYERSRRLGVPITMHACFNGMNIALALWGSSGGNAPPPA